MVPPQDDCGITPVTDFAAVVGVSFNCRSLNFVSLKET
jgi:hypothetical protein